MLVSLFAETFEGLGVTIDVGVSSTNPPTTLIAPVSAAPYVLVSVLPTTPIITGPSESPFTLSPSLLLLRKFVLFFFLVHRFSFHALCFLDRSTPYCSFSV